MRIMLTACAAVLLAFASPIAIAQEGAPVVAVSEVPEATEVLVTEDTSVTLPAGEELKAITDALVNVLAPVLMTILGGLMLTLPGYVRVLVGTFLTEKNIRLAIQHAINRIPGASTNEPLKIDVGNKVVASAAQYFVDSVPGWLVTWLGGRQAIADKVLSRINLEPAAGASTTHVSVPLPKSESHQASVISRDPRHVTNRT